MHRSIRKDLEELKENAENTTGLTKEIDGCRAFMSSIMRWRSGYSSETPDLSEVDNTSISSQGSQFVTLKVRVLLALSYGRGLRASKVVRLRVVDIDSAQNIIRVAQAKGRKDCNVMLSPKLLALLRQWWKVRPRRYDIGMAPAERWLFPGRRPGKPMTTRQLNRLFHETLDAAGICRSVEDLLRVTVVPCTSPIRLSLAFNIGCFPLHNLKLNREG
jgi:hypothetical protein